MRQVLVKALGHTALLLVLVAAIGGSRADAQDRKQKEESSAPRTQERSGEWANSLEGTWEVQTTIRNCQTGVVMESFSKLVSFEKGGTAHETSSSSLFRSTAFGIWQDHWGTARYLLRFFRFNPDGTPAGSVRALWYVIPRGDSYTGQAYVEIVAPNGVTVATLCGSERGTRLEFPF